MIGISRKILNLIINVSSSRNRTNYRQVIFILFIDKRGNRVLKPRTLDRDVEITIEDVDTTCVKLIKINN